MTLEQKVTEARRLGMSYGKYVAKYHPSTPALSKPQEPEPPRCVVCDAVLKGMQRKFCGEVCRTRGYRKSGKEKCAVCGAPSGPRKYCSDECRRKAKTMMQRKYRAGGAK